MECVILIRMQNGSVVAMMDDEQENVEVFPSRKAAEELASGHILCKAMPHQIVELDEL